MPQTQPTVTQLAEQIAGGAPHFDSVGRRVAVALYRELAKGAPVAPGRLATLLELPHEAVAGALSGRTVVHDRDGAVVGFGGLTVAEMPPHRFLVDGRTLYTWCAWDSLFIPGILGRTAEVVSRDPVTGLAVSLTVAPDRIQRVDPPTAVVSFLVPDRPSGGDVIRNFCRFVHFFGSEQTGGAWTAGHPGTFLLPVEEAFALGRLTNARNFGDALGAGPAS